MGQYVYIYIYIFFENDQYIYIYIYIWEEKKGIHVYSHYLMYQDTVE